MGKTKHIALLGSLIGLIGPAQAANYNENLLGDLSDTFTTPTLVELDAGANFITANVTSADDDFFTITIPVGFVVNELTLVSYNHPLFGNESFIGYQDGSQLDQNPADLIQGEISFALIGDGDMGTIINDKLAANPSAAATPLPLTAGDYAFWLNETDDLPASVSLRFDAVPVPEPSTLFFTLPALAFFLRRRIKPHSLIS